MKYAIIAALTVGMLAIACTPDESGTSWRPIATERPSTPAPQPTEDVRAERATQEAARQSLTAKLESLSRIKALEPAWVAERERYGDYLLIGWNAIRDGFDAVRHSTDSAAARLLSIRLAQSLREEAALMRAWVDEVEPTDACLLAADERSDALFRQLADHIEALPEAADPYGALTDAQMMTMDALRVIYPEAHACVGVVCDAENNTCAFADGKE